MSYLLDLLPGLYLGLLAFLLAAALRRWYDSPPATCWLIWGLALLPVFAPVLLAGRVLLPLGYPTQLPPFTHVWSGPRPGNLIQSDVILLIQPWFVAMRAHFASGIWPLWNHLAGAGEPLLGNPQSLAWQPLAWLAAPLDAATAPALIAALKVLLAQVFTYLFLRRQGISHPPALWSSLAFAFAGFLQLWLGWPLSASAAFLPVILYGWILVEERGRRRDLLLLALAIAGLLTAGHPETELHVALLVTAFALLRLPRLPELQRRRVVAHAGAAVLLAILWTAPLLMTGSAFLPQTLRATQLRERVAAGPADPGLVPGERPGRASGALSRLLPIAAPNTFGNNRLGSYWGHANTVDDASGFTGTAALLACLLACLPLGSGRRFPQERLFLVTGAILLVVLASPPVLIRFFLAVPVLSGSLYFHTRGTILLNFAIAYGAACSWERWRRGELRRGLVLPLALALGAFTTWAYLAHPNPRFLLLLAPFRWASLAVHLAVLTAATIWLAQRPWREAGTLWPSESVLSIGGALLVAGELLAIHAPANPPSPRVLYRPQMPAIGYVAARLDPWHRLAGLGPALRPNLATLFDLADARSAGPQKPMAVLEATGRINMFPRRPADGFVNPEDPLYALLGVRLLMTEPRVPVGPPWHLGWSGEDAWVYTRDDALGRLFLPARAIPCPPPWAACTATIKDFAATAAAQVSELPQGAWSASGGSARLVLGELEPQEIRAGVDAPESRLLATSIFQDGGWRLLVNRRRMPTTLANGPFVAAWLPAGQSDVALLYRPSAFLLGLPLAGLGLAFAAALTVPAPRRAGAQRTAMPR